MENIKSIFTSEDMAEMKIAMKKIVVKQFEKEMEELDVYLFDPSYIDDMITETYQEILKELKDELKRKLKEKMFAGIDSKLNKLIK